MVDEVLHLKSRCGGGKSIGTITGLYDFLLGSQDETVVFASKKLDLSAQNHESFIQKQDVAALAEGQQFIPIPHIRIDIETVSGSTVKARLHECLDSGFRGVIFVSHAVLTSVDPKKMRHVRLIVDEVPSNLVKHIDVKYKEKGGGNSWENYIVTNPCNHVNYEIVSINPNANLEEISQRARDIRSEKDTNDNKKVGVLLEFLLDGNESVYTTVISSGNKKNEPDRVYQAIDWRGLRNITSNVRRFSILAAQLKDTLVGFVLNNVIAVGIEDAVIPGNVPLETQHKNKARIYPMLSTGRWSTYLKDRIARNALCLNGQPVPSDETVIQYAQTIAKKIIQGRESLLILNKKDGIHPDLDIANVESISSGSHGLNIYRNFDHAIYLSSNRYNTYEEKALRIFAKDYGVFDDSIVEAVITERCHELCYQNIARTSIRNDVVKAGVEHVFVVPDMAHAKYLLQWFDGGAVIDETYSHTRITARSGSKREKDLNKIIQVRRDYQANMGRIEDICKVYSLNKRTYYDHAKRFEKELMALGL